MQEERRREEEVRDRRCGERAQTEKDRKRRSRAWRKKKKKKKKKKERKNSGGEHCEQCVCTGAKREVKRAKGDKAGGSEGEVRKQRARSRARY